MQDTARLSRRERQIMDIRYASGHATAAEIQHSLPDAPSYSATRALIRVLEENGHVRHEEQGPRYVFRPALGRDKAKKSALKHLLRTFFEGSPEQAVATLLDISAAQLKDEDFDRLSALIDKARKEGK
jgi:BlaI family penicillinase repressor